MLKRNKLCNTIALKHVQYSRKEYPFGPHSLKYSTHKLSGAMSVSCTSSLHQEEEVWWYSKPWWYRGTWWASGSYETTDKHHVKRAYDDSWEECLDYKLQLLLWWTFFFFKAWEQGWILFLLFHVNLAFRIWRLYYIKPPKGTSYTLSHSWIRSLSLFPPKFAR